MKKYWMTALLIASGLAVMAAEPVKLSAFGSPEDGGAAFRKALESGARRIVIDKMEKDWIFSPCELPSDLEVTIEKGVRITDDPEKIETNSPLFFAENQKNISFLGNEGVEILLHKKDYIMRRNAGEKDAVWNGREYVTKHVGAKPVITDGFSFRGCTGITVKKLKVLSSGGDGVYLGTTRAVNQCRDVVLEDLVLDDNMRMGITIICAENVVIRRCTMSRSSGTMPMFGMDMEPGGATGKLKNILLEDCVFDSNANGGLVICPQVKEVSVTVRGCTFRNSPSAFQINYGNPEFEGNHITAENCRIENADLYSIAIRGHNHNYPIHLRDIEIRNAPTIRILAELAEVRNTGNIHFKNVRYTDCPKVTRPLSFVPVMLAGANMRNVTGDITVNGEKHDVPEYIRKEGLDKENFHEAWPVDLSLAEPVFPDRKGAPVPFFSLYGHVSYLIWAENANPLTFRLKGGSGKWRLEPVMVAPDKSKVNYPAVPSHLGEQTYSLVPRFRGAYNLKLDPSYAWVTFMPQDPFKWAMTATENDSFIILGQMPKKLPLYFLFPKDVKTCWISVCPPDKGSGSISVIDASGKEHARLSDFRYCRTFEIRRNTSGEEVWSLAFKTNPNRMGIRLAGIPPYLADRPENVFRHRKTPRKPEEISKGVSSGIDASTLESMLEEKL